MTLKERFLNLKNKGTYFVIPIEEDAILCEQIADEFAIEFAEWCNSNYTKLHSVWCPIYTDQRNRDNWKTTKELLEIFKKEKGL